MLKDFTNSDYYLLTADTVLPPSASNVVGTELINFRFRGWTVLKFLVIRFNIKENVPVLVLHVLHLVPQTRIGFWIMAHMNR